MPEQLLTPELIANLSGLELKARMVVDSVLAGQHRSQRKGFSTEFAEHREYSPGDDLRYIDWKVYGKRDRYYVKQFEDERRLRAWLVLDASRSMHYRSAEAPMSKLEYAAVLAAALAWLILRQRDETGVACVGGNEASLLPPQGNPVHLKQVMAFLEQQVASVPDRDVLVGETPPVPRGDSHSPSGSQPGPGMDELAEQFGPRSLVVWMTDAFSEASELEKTLRHLRFRRHDVRLLHVIDPAEEDFPFDEPAIFRSLEGGVDQFITPRSIRTAYQAEWKSFMESVQRTARELECDYQKVRTDSPPDRVLREWLGR